MASQRGGARATAREAVTGLVSPRWRKLSRDVWTQKGRTALMVTAIAVSLLGIGTVLGAYAILTREMARNYLGTHPASAALELSAGVDPSVVEEVRRRPGIAEAEAGDIVLARAKVGDDWRPLLLFVVDDFNAMRLNTFKPQSGAWPPPDGTMLIERTAASMLEATEGDSVMVKTPHGAPRAVPITGLVHDPGLAPAWQEREGYGYITRTTLAQLGEPPVLGELRITVRDNPLDLKAIEATAAELSQWLGVRGHSVLQVRVPPPGRHPHQTQMMGVLFLMLAFSAMALVLSAILVATSISAMLARQVREIGVMKTVGARTGQIAWMYGVLIALVGLAAVALALPASVGGARFLAAIVANMLNLRLESERIPWWVFAVGAASGVLVPLLVAAVPIARGSQVTVREAIDQYGVGPLASRGQWRSWVALPPWVSRTVLLAVRNAFRRRGRLALTLALLAAGGAMFMTALNVSRGWERIVDRVYENRSYDVEIRLNAPATVVERLRRLDGVRAVEVWGYAATALSRPGQVDVVRTYPDGSHGSLAMMGPPPETGLVRFPLLAGRWLRAGDTDAVVLNHMVLGQAPGITVGDRVTLSLGGRPTSWRVVGIVEEVGSPGVAYVTDEAFARAAGTEGRVRMLRIATRAGSPHERAEIIRAIERELEARQVSVESAIPLAVLHTAMGDHVVVLIRMLLAMALLMVTVGMLGLGSTMGINVIERTRELGVMKTIGAAPRQIGRLVVGEALFVGVLSWGVATALAVPLTAVVGKTVGMLSFRVRLPLVMDLAAVSGWLALVVIVSIAATALPARRASRLTVREALAQL
ncbi:MAG: ABC transporter permease [Myxococcaceae bacterium]|nr:ABC transporter permease [Myxococcaceae bacterium]